MTEDIGCTLDLMGIKRGEAPLRKYMLPLPLARGEGRVRG
jgi:hypothetical protein